MKLRVLGSSSRGNGYILYNDEEALIIECGYPLIDCLKVLNFDRKRIKGALLTHEHGDHSKYVKDYLDAAISVYASEGTIKEIGNVSFFGMSPIKSGNQLVVGGFVVMPFGTQHDCAEPLGFLINHKEMGNLLFATDTYYIRYKFPHLRNVMIECNYDIPLIDKSVREGVIPPFVMRRIMKSHMSLDTTIETLKENDLSNVDKVILLHLSSNNSDADYFKSMVEQYTGKLVLVANSGMDIDLEQFNYGQ